MRKLYTLILFLTFGFQPVLAAFELSDVIKEAREKQMSSVPVSRISEKKEKPTEIKEPSCACDKEKEVKSSVDKEAEKKASAVPSPVKSASTDKIQTSNTKN